MSTTVLLTYVGGAVMFTVHALIRREKGPPISNLDHWLLDSTLGFIALAPVVIIGVALLARLVPAHSRRFPLIAGAAFAIITVPGPILHDKVVGEDTFGANLAARFCGINHAALVRHGIEHSALSECLVQLAVGIPTYIVLFYASWFVGVTFLALRWTRRQAIGAPLAAAPSPVPAPGLMSAPSAVPAPMTPELYKGYFDTTVRVP